MNLSPIPVRTRLFLGARRLLGSGSAPNLLIIGAQKAGTSSLAAWLAQHLGIASPWLKEVHYFDNNFDKGPGWYRSHFSSSPKLLSLDSSPYYLFHPRAAARAAASVPEARIVAILRDPADRAYSQYRMNLRAGLEDLTFPEALEAEEDRLAGSHEDLRSERISRHRNHQLYSYRARGLYADQLREWLRFFAWDRLLLLRFDDLAERPAAALEETWRFLGLPDFTPPDMTIRNRALESRGEEDEDAVIRLRKSFEHANEDLRELTGIDFRSG